MAHIYSSCRINTCSFTGVNMVYITESNYRFPQRLADFVAFGLILHISNINEIEHFNDSEKSWKTIQNGISIAFISFYSVLYACSILGQSNPGLINVKTITYFSLGLSLVSFLISFSVYDRISKLEQIS